jgi:branched-chain amino acid aminotransferase
MNNSIAWIDGEYIVTNQANITVMSQTFHYGFGVYEGIRSYQTAQGAAIFRQEDHTDRLFQSADLLGIKIPYEKALLNHAQHDLLKKNNLSNAYLRPIVFMGDEYLGLHTEQTSVHVMIAAIAWKNNLVIPENFNQGISIKTSSYERPVLKNNLHKAKACGLYLISILANNEARSEGFDEALLLDPHGFIAEGSGANIFIVKDNVLYTPHLDFSLDGITRRTVMQIAKDSGISVVEKQITQDELLQSDELFFTGTASEIMPITRVDGRVIASGNAGSLTKKIAQLYMSTVTGLEKKYQPWLSVKAG